MRTQKHNHHNCRLRTTRRFVNSHSRLSLIVASFAARRLEPGCVPVSVIVLKVLLPVNVAAEEARAVRRCPLSLFGARAPLLFHPSTAAGLVSRWAGDEGAGCLRSRLPDWKELLPDGSRL